MLARIIPTSWIVASAVFGAGVCMPGLVLGQQVECAPTPVALQMLDEQHLQPMWAGLDDRGLITTIYVDEAGRWTMVISDANGLSCKVTTGEGAFASVPVFGVES